MLLDRGLTLEQLEIAFEIGTSDPDPKSNRRRMTMALRDVVSEQEASGKTKKCLTRVWLNPPSSAAEMIAWVRGETVDRNARAVLHFGALLATYPFVGIVCRVIGQHLQTEGRIGAAAVRSEVRRLVGDRPSVEVAARKSYTTLRNLGLLQQDAQDLFLPDAPPECPRVLAGWLAHGLILSRQVESIPFSSVLAAPELLGMTLSAPDLRCYPLLESHAAASGDILVPRHGGAARQPGLPDSRLF